MQNRNVTNETAKTLQFVVTSTCSIRSSFTLLFQLNPNTVQYNHHQVRKTFFIVNETKKRTLLGTFMALLEIKS